MHPIKQRRTASCSSRLARIDPCLVARSGQRTVRQGCPESADLTHLHPCLRKSALTQSPVSEIELGFIAKALQSELSGCHEKMAAPAAARIILPWLDTTPYRSGRACANSEQHRTDARHPPDHGSLAGVDGGDRKVGWPWTKETEMAKMQRTQRQERPITTADRNRRDGAFAHRSSCGCRAC